MVRSTTRAATTPVPRGQEELTTRPIASLYLRISVATDQSDSIERQERDLRRMAAAEGFEVGYVHIDEGVSGASSVRPAFRAWLNDALSGRAQVLLAWRFDRISRDGLPALARLLEVLNASSARMLTFDDRMDSASSSFRITAAVLAEIAFSEREGIRTRVASRQASDRQRGYWTKPRPFGYQVEGGHLVQDEYEAPLVRLMVDMLLAPGRGATLRGLAKWLTERGVPTPRALKGQRTNEGATWGVTSVRAILGNPALAGFYPHNGRPARDDQGELIVVADKPILSLGEWVRLTTKLEERSQLGPLGRKAPKSGAEPKHALTGLLKCECGASLAYDGSRLHREPRFRCIRKGANAAACVGLTLDVRQVEEAVFQAAVSRVGAIDPGSPTFEAVALRWFREQDPIDAAERKAAENSAAEAEVHVADLEIARYERGEFPGADGAVRWKRLYDRAQARLYGAREALEAFPLRKDVGDLLDPAVFAQSLNAGSTADRSALLRLVLLSARAVRRGKPDTSPADDRVRVSYRDRVDLGVDFEYLWVEAC